MRKISVFVAILLVFAFCFTTIGEFSKAEAADKVYKWRLVTHSMVGTYRFSHVEAFAEMINKASGGRLVVEPYGAGVLFPVFDSFDAIKDGVVEMGLIFSAYWTGKDPLFGIFATRPGSPLLTFQEGMYLDQRAFPIIEKAYGKHGITYLGTTDCSVPEILMMRTPIRTLEDFKGKQIRSSGMGAQFYTALGASAVSLSAPEIYTALQTGTIDAAEWTEWKENEEMGLLEVTKFVMDPAHHGGINEDKALIVNAAKWAELPDDLKHIVLAARDHMRYLSAITNFSEARKTKNEWLAKGVDIITLSDEDVVKVREIAANVLKEWAKKSPECQEYLDLYAEVLNELGYTKEAATLGFKAK